MSKEITISDIKNKSFFMKGKRGYIYTGFLGKTKVAIKKKNPKSQAIGRIHNEAEKLKILNKHKIGPKLIKAGKDYMIYKFIKGIFIKQFLENEKTTKTQIKKVLKAIFEQCFVMDKLKLQKEEMTNPYKHVIIDNTGNKKNNPKAVLVDFERCRTTEKPGNVTQFSQYILRNKVLLEKKHFKINKKAIISAAKKYKYNMSKQNLGNIIKKIR